MSLVVKVLKSIKSQKEVDSKKKIRKERHKNQYTQDISLMSKETTNVKQQQINFQITIPQHLRNLTIFRISSDIHFPIDYQDQRLGELLIDPFSYNYHIVRIDKTKDLYSFTLEPVDRPITPFSTIYDLLSQKLPVLANNLCFYDQRYSKIDQMKLSTLEDVKNFEKSLHCPFDCRVSKFKNGEHSTTQRMFNMKFCEMMGVTENMLYSYISETKLLPNTINFDTQDPYMQNFNNCLEQAIQSQTNVLSEVLNFQGQRFCVKLTQRNFLIYNGNENSYYDINYWMFDCDKNWLGIEQMQKNQNEYFQAIDTRSNEREFKISTGYESTQQYQNLQQCGYRMI